MKRKKRGSEWILLVLPCIALGIFAWYQGRPRIYHYAPVIQNIQILPATPRQIYKGFDTRIVLTMGDVDVPPRPNATPTKGSYAVSNQSLIFHEVGKADMKLLPVSAIGTVIAKDHTIDIPVKLSGLTKKQEAILQLFIRQHIDYLRELRLGIGIPYNNGGWYSPPNHQRLVIKTSNRQVAVPAVSHFCPVSFESAVAQQVLLAAGSTGGIQPCVELVIKLRNKETGSRAFADPLFFGDERLETEKGETYILEQPGSKVPSESTISVSSFGEPIEYSFIFQMNRIPPSSGRITFKTEASTDDCWPIPISIVVRDHIGKVLYGNAKNEP